MTAAGGENAVKREAYPLSHRIAEDACGRLVLDGHELAALELLLLGDVKEHWRERERMRRRVFVVSEES